MVLHFLLLTSMLGTFSQGTNGEPNQATDLEGQLFLFPEESSTSNVVLQPSLTTPVKSFTVCLRALTELTRDYSLFSGSNPKKENDLLIFHNDRAGDPYSITVGNHPMYFKTYGSITERNHICAAWDSTAGVVQLWVNGKPSVRKVLNKGYYIEKDLKIILGQEQDSYGGSFDAKQSFVGEIGDVHMWNYVLSSADILQVMFNNTEYNGNVISWRALRFEMKGHVLVVPVQQLSN